MKKLILVALLGLSGCTDGLEDFDAGRSTSARVTPFTGSQCEGTIQFKTAGGSDNGPIKRFRFEGCN